MSVRIATLGWASGMAFAALLAAMIGAEHARWFLPVWYDGEVIRWCGFAAAVLAAFVVGIVVPRRYAAGTAAARWVWTLSGLGMLAFAAWLFAAVFLH